MHPATIEKLVSRTLRGGVLMSASLLVVGTIGLFLHPSSMPPTVSAPTLAEFFQAIATGASSFSIPILLLHAGILVLALTPLARVLITLLGFTAQKDWTFVVLSFIVLLVITVSISLSVS